MGRRGKKADGPEGMKACYRAAKESGDREEEARWANQIGHAYKDRGDYVDALIWFRLDYDISVKRQFDGPRLNLMPTCQSLGEIYHRLGDYRQALHYQERHLELSVEANDLVEQQRAYTQLGRTYMDMYEFQEDVLALPKAKDSFNKAMELVKKLKANPVPGYASTYIVELVDAYNNLGTMKMVTDEPLEARRLLLQGLRICDEEEVGQNDAARTRVHHNLGRLYAEKRQWAQAMSHVLKDIEICRALPHPQGEVKGLINLADIHFKQRQYIDAIRCYNLAHVIVRKLQDEDGLMKTVETNKEVVEAAIPKLKAFNLSLAKHKELQSQVDTARGTALERSLCLKEFKVLKELIGQAFELQYWEEHLKLAKRLKKVVDALGDLEKMGDALDTIGESYCNLCNYEKAKKWHLKSYKVCQRVHHDEGQAVALINYGNALDSSGDFKGALKAYQQAYDIVKESGDNHFLDLKISALQNMHYCYVVRFSKFNDARVVEAEMKKLEQFKEDREIEKEEDSDDRCSETDDEAEEDTTQEAMNIDDEELATSCTLLGSTFNAQGISDPQGKTESRTGLVRRSQAPDFRKRSRMVLSDEESEESDDAMLPSPPKRKYTRSNARGPSAPKERPSSSVRKSKRPESGALNLCSDDDEPLATALEACKAAKRNKKSSLRHSKLTKDQGIEHKNVNSLNSKTRNSGLARRSDVVQRSPGRRPMQEDGDWTFTRSLGTGNASRRKDEDFNDESQPLIQVAGDMGKTLASGSLVRGSQREARKSSSSHQDGATSHNSDTQARSNVIQAPLIVPVNINGQTLRVIIKRSETERNKTVGWLMEEIIRLYTCDNSAGKKPVVQRLEFKGSILKPIQIIEEVLNDFTADDSIDAIIQGWVAIPVVERYEAHCIAANTSVNAALALKLKLLKGSYEEVDASSCDLQDISVRPLINALQENEALSFLDLSHNLLGNATINAIQEMVAATNQCDLGLTLDLHKNQLGAGALVQIAKCPVTLSRLEVLKLSGNRLTDAAGRNLAAIVGQSKALATLEIERCGLTTRTIQQISSSLQPESSLVKLCIGHNNPIGGSALSSLFQKLSRLLSFTELDIRGIELDDKGVLAAASLMKSSSLSVLNMAGCEIQNHGAQVMCKALAGTTVQLLNLDLSSCRLSREPALEVCHKMASIYGLSTLNLSNNQLSEQGAEVLSLALRQEECRWKSLTLDDCCIGQTGVLLLLQALEGNSVLWELHVAGNFKFGITESLAMAIVPSIDLDVSNHVTQQTPKSSNSALNQEQGSGVPLNGTEHSRSTFSNCNAPYIIKKTDSNLQETSDHEGQHAAIDLGTYDKPYGDAFLNELTQVEEGFPEISEIVKDIDGGLADSDSNEKQADSHVIENLIKRIRMAQGLECLNMKKNGLSTEVLKHLWEAWCHCGRTASTEFVSKAHFVVRDGRECSALTSSCVYCQPRAQ